MHEKIFTQWGCLSFFSVQNWWSFLLKKKCRQWGWDHNVLKLYIGVRISAVWDLFATSLTFTVSLSNIAILVFFLLLLIKVVSIQEVFCKGRQFPYKVFCDDPVRHDFFPQYRDAPTLFLRMKFFDTRIFCNTERFPYNFFFSAVRQKTFQRRKFISASYAWKCAIPQVF